MDKRKKSVLTGWIISLVAVCVCFFIKNLLSRSQIINFFDRQGFNDVTIVLISMVISFGLTWLYIVIKYGKKRNKVARNQEIKGK
jgi:uncharacterized BrkB/YihY/UPF0761 family membrane protein